MFRGQPSIFTFFLLHQLPTWKGFHFGAIGPYVPYVYLSLSTILNYFQFFGEIILPFGVAGIHHQSSSVAGPLSHIRWKE